MSTEQMDGKSGSRHLGRSIGALLAGFVVGTILSLGTDIGLHGIGLFPALGTPIFSSGLLLLATTYRSIYGVISSYVTARLAPDRPLQHALVGGAVGVVLNIAGIAATWNRGLGPHWYPLMLLTLTLPIAWIGGTLREKQLRPEAAVH